MNIFIRIRNRINCRIIRWLLKSAVVFEVDSYKLYTAVKDAVKGTSAALEIEILLREEKTHEKLIKDIVTGRIDCSGIKTSLKKIPRIHFKSIKAIEPLGEDVLKRIGFRLNDAVKQEKDSFRFYSNLYRISTMRSVKEAFRFLAGQEAVHLLVLQKLMGIKDDNSG